MKEKLNKWIKKKIATFSLAMMNVEQNVLSQRSNELDSKNGHQYNIGQGTLVDSLTRGVITEEVKKLRWRMYKVIDEVNTREREKNKKINSLFKIKMDDYDPYPIELVINNEMITTGVNDSLNNDYIDSFDKPIINYDESGEIESVTHGEIKSNNFNIQKNERPIVVYRDSIPKFEIENYASKLNVRVINDTDRLLEFYISIYPDENNRTTRLLISDIKKAMINPRSVNFLDINKVGFITYNDIGANDFLEYQYKIKSFDKIIEYNGSYVIKFIAEVVINGESIIEKFRNIDLDEKYKKKEAKKIKI